MRNRTTKPTKKTTKISTKKGDLQIVSIKDLDDVNGGACCHAGTCSHAADQQQPRRWL